nr:MAG TPA_asm: hypothetical protein [Caudoviricetes sp.]
MSLNLLHGAFREAGPFCYIRRRESCIREEVDQKIACIHSFSIPPFGEYASGRKFGFFGHDMKNVVEQFSLAHCRLSFLCACEGCVFLSIKKDLPLPLQQVVMDGCTQNKLSLSIRSYPPRNAWPKSPPLSFLCRRIHYSCLRALIQFHIFELRIISRHHDAIVGSAIFALHNGNKNIYAVRNGITLIGKCIFRDIGWNGVCIFGGLAWHWRRFRPIRFLHRETCSICTYGFFRNRRRYNCIAYGIDANRKPNSISTLAFARITGTVTAPCKHKSQCQHTYKNPREIFHTPRYLHIPST